MLHVQVSPEGVSHKMKTKCWYGIARILEMHETLEITIANDSPYDPTGSASRVAPRYVPRHRADSSPVDDEHGAHSRYS
jgi:hypothetical protein